MRTKGGAAMRAAVKGKMRLNGEAKKNAAAAGGWVEGIGFTLLVAIAGFGLSRLPGLDRIGPMACAILIAVFYRQYAGYPERFRTGIQFASKRLLRLAIILFGLRLNINVLLQEGPLLLIRDAGMAAGSIGLMLLLARMFKADMPLSLLLGIGTGICGAAAIAAVSPIVKAKEEDTALGAGMIAVVGTLFAVGYTLIRPIIGLKDAAYGVWSGISLHEIAHVALAAAPAGQDTLAVALMAKLGRVFLLIPVSLLLMAWMKSRAGRAAAHETGEAAASPQIEVPWFLAGFIAMSLIGSFVLGRAVVLPESISNGLPTVTTFMLTMAMVGLGLNVSLRSLGAPRLRALGVMTAVSVMLSLLVYIVVK